MTPLEKELSEAQDNANKIITDLNKEIETQKQSRNRIYFCIKTHDGRYMPIVTYIKELEAALDRELMKNDRK